MNEPTYAELKALTERGRRSIRDLLALSPQHDPWAVDLPGRRRDAEWFAELWAVYGVQGDHLRRVHYRLVSQATPLLLPDGVTPYTNTEACWATLGEASKGARYLRLVDPHAFVDRRNPDAHLFVRARPTPVPQSWFMPPEWALPEIDSELDDQIDLTLPRPFINGYDYAASDQPFHLEVWVEKSTMDDVLLPVCERFGVNYVTGLGFLSITRTTELIQRVLERAKPARIFYISDFDPAGDGMPVSIARQIQWLAREDAPGTEFKLTPIVLTADQVRQYTLPRSPIKDSDLRKGTFETRHGEGATELDALEALYPGELARLVQVALEPYVDPQLAAELARQRYAVQTAADDAWEEATEDLEEERTALEGEISAVARNYAVELKALADRLDSDLSPFVDRVLALRRELSERSDRFDPELPERWTSDVEAPDEEEWLFDSKRPYFQQNSHYQARKRPHPSLPATHD